MVQLQNQTPQHLVTPLLRHRGRFSSGHQLEQQSDLEDHLKLMFVEFQQDLTPKVHQRVLKMLMAKHRFHHHDLKLEQHQHGPYLHRLQPFLLQPLQLA